jgi:hypothetical protein
VLPDGGCDPADVEAVRPPDRLAQAMQFLDDRIAVPDGLLPDCSSSGVQIVGGTSPAERHTASMVPRSAAFARCLHFHVSRKST